MTVNANKSNSGSTNTNEGSSGGVGGKTGSGGAISATGRSSPNAPAPGGIKPSHIHPVDAKAPAGTNKESNREPAGVCMDYYLPSNKYLFPTPLCPIQGVPLPQVKRDLSSGKSKAKGKTLPKIHKPGSKSADTADSGSYSNENMNTKGTNSSTSTAASSSNKSDTAVADGGFLLGGSPMIQQATLTNIEITQASTQHK